MTNIVAFFGAAILTALLVIIWWIVRVSRRADRCLRLAVTALAATPVSTDEAMDDMKYEYWDFETAAVVMGLRLMPDDPEDVRKIRKRLRRWRDRLMKERK